MLAVAAGLGLLIGVVVGGLGGGGGVLAIPVLVYLLGQTAQDATTSSVIIVGVTALVGALARIRSNLIDWRTGLIFGGLGIISAYPGTLLNQHVASRLLLLVFAAITVIVAATMLLSQGSSPKPTDDGPDGPDMDGPDPAHLGTPRTGIAVAAPPRTLRAVADRVRRRQLSTAAKVVSCGLAVGFLTGFLGIGGGFLVVPALAIVLRMPMPVAIGTSLMIIAMNSTSSFLARVQVAQFDWRIILPFTLGAIAGTFLGKRVADRLPGTALTKAFAAMLVLVGVFVAVESLALT